MKGKLGNPSGNVNHRLSSCLRAGFNEFNHIPDLIVNMLAISILYWVVKILKSN